MTDLNVLVIEECLWVPMTIWDLALHGVNSLLLLCLSVTLLWRAIGRKTCARCLSSGNRHARYCEHCGTRFVSPLQVQ
ncbi:hypothetical protein LCGC14_2998670, partial [marine sediment metagenome]